MFTPFVEEIIYFTYGSNMDHHRMLSRGMEFSKSEIALLEGYKIIFNKIADENEGTGYTNIEKDTDKTVIGVLYHITSSIKKLDGFEGYSDHYGKTRLTVRLKNGKNIEAITYIAKKIKDGLKPKRSYLQHLILGAKQHDFPKYYIKFLENIQTAD